MSPFRKPPHQLTPLELEIMKVLWDQGPSTVQAVQENLAGDRLAYTTVQTMLNVLHRKRRVKRTLAGKAYVYVPVLSREKASSQALTDILDRLFGGSVESLIMSLMQSRDLDEQKIQQLRKLIAGHSAEKEGRNGRD